MNSQSLEPLIHLEKGFKVLDQKKLPISFEYINVNNSKETFQVIREMNVRGAPFIAVVALYGLREELKNNLQNIQNVQQFKEFVLEQIQYLKQSRPTAVNLFNDTDFILDFTNKLSNDITVQQAFDQVNEQVIKIDKDYVEASNKMAQIGYEKVLVDVPRIKDDKINVLTICNTGKLAVPGIGTALGLIREIHRQGKLNQVYIPETRPYLQGFRLTASEVVSDNMPGTMITDSMAGFLMKQGKIDLVVIGADRVAVNGDTANKIGSYTFSVLAKSHGIPFYTVLPDSTIDRQCENGDQIEIEQRPSQELIYVNGQQIGPEGLNCYNPAFDVTPSTNITRVITEKGEFEFDRESSQWSLMNKEKLSVYLKEKLQYFGQEEDLDVSEIGDGNLNLVFIIKSNTTGKQVICKQALPYVRCVGPEWPFPLSRAYYESQALKFHNKYVQEYTPKLIHFDKQLALITMEYLQPPYIILRKGLINQTVYANAATHIAEFAAKTLFFSSGLHLSNDKLRERMQFWCGNTSLCSLTEQVIFLDPYYEAEHNKHTSPQLDSISSQFQNDNELLFAVQQLRHKFIHLKQALLHGDLHTGSVMATETETRVIDAEFAFYGPIGFDIGAVLANYFLNYFSQKSRNGEQYTQYIGEQVKTFWNIFQQKFLELWSQEANYENGCDYPKQFLQKSEQLATQIRSGYIKNLWQDTLGFTAAKIIRRILGIAHVEDLESIENPDVRADCEKRALLFAREIMVNSQNYANIEQITELAAQYYNKQL